jgi:hypothetical protein
MCINECLFINGNDIHSIGKEFFHQFRKELSIVSKLLNDSFDLWSSYFKLSQTRYHRLFNDGIFYNKELLKIELLKQDPYLAELKQTVHRLENQLQNVINELLKHFNDLLIQKRTPSRSLPYTKNNENDIIMIATLTMYYSIIKLVKSAIILGTNVHTIFEVETTHQYIRY